MRHCHVKSFSLYPKSIIYVFYVLANFKKKSDQIINLFYINKHNIRSKANLEDLKEIHYTLHKIHCAKFKIVQNQVF
jgi:hypothetical protein